jgi:hypothetical protein
LPAALRAALWAGATFGRVNHTVIAQMMGHTQLRTTSRYIANNAEHHRVAIGAISGRIKKIANGGQDAAEAGTGEE